jgi:hypothetical protein
VIKIKEIDKTTTVGLSIRRLLRGCRPGPLGDTTTWAPHKESGRQSGEEELLVAGSKTVKWQ